jgi:iron complex transport system ATP-binding protein
LTGITSLADRSVLAISGGELQRVIIARALAQQPRLLLLDEPTSHLDLGHQIDILQTIRRMSREIAVIGVFHDLNYASHYCDRLVLLHDHRILVMGTPEEVLTPENIRTAFGIEVNVKANTSTGRPFITPVYSPETSPGCGDTRVHVICGGGTGSTILHALHHAGCRVTTGVLSMNDSDYETAIQLGIPCVVEPPFAPITPGSRSLLEEELKNSDIVVITGMPVGTGNLDNLRAVVAADEVPLVFLTESGTFGIDDFTGGEAVLILEGLIRSGRLEVLSRTEVLGKCTGSSRTI